MRIVGHPTYPHPPSAPGAVAALLVAMRALPGRTFWPDSISTADDSRFHVARLLNPAQLTDSYLLALARAHGGRLVTLDRKLAVDAVVGGRAALELL